MERRVWIVSLVTAVAGVALLRLYLHRVEQQLSGGPKTRVLVFARDLPAGTPLTRALLGERDLPRAYLESRHVRARDLEQVAGARLAVSGRATEALAWTDLAGVRETARSLSSLVPEGMRAYALALPQAGLDELIAPGDRVDVLLTAPQRGTTAALRASSVAENLLVLAVGADLGRAGAARAALRGGRGVTLAVTPEQSQRLAAAERGGALQLVLRNPDDLTVSHGAGANVLSPSDATAALPHAAED